MKDNAARKLRDFSKTPIENVTFTAVKLDGDIIFRILSDWIKATTIVLTVYLSGK